MVYLSIISEIVNEVRIKLTAEGMSIVAVDPANVAMILFKLPKESFSQYEAGSEVWGVNLSDLKLILRRASNSSSIVFEQEENQLKISIFDKVKRVFNMSLIEIESEEKNEPSLEFSCRVEISSDNLSQALEDCSVVADACTFITGKDFFILEGKGSLNSSHTEFSGDEAKITGMGKSKYSLEYLIKFIKAIKISEKAIIQYAEDYPLRLDFPGNEAGLGFILAPRVENDWF